MRSLLDDLSYQKPCQRMTRSNSIGGITRCSQGQTPVSQQTKEPYDAKQELNTCNNQISPRDIHIRGTFSYKRDNKEKTEDNYYIVKDDSSDDSTEEDEDKKSIPGEHSIYAPGFVDYLSDVTSVCTQTIYDENINNETRDSAAICTDGNKRFTLNDVNDLHYFHSLRRQDTLLLSEDDEDDDADEYMAFESLKKMLCVKLPDDDTSSISMDDHDQDMDETVLQNKSCSYKNLLATLVRLRCAMCGSNLEIPTFPHLSMGFENDDFPSFLHEDGYMGIDLDCPQCCCTRSVYHPH